MAARFLSLPLAGTIVWNRIMGKNNWNLDLVCDIYVYHIGFQSKVSLVSIQITQLAHGVEPPSAHEQNAIRISCVSLASQWWPALSC